MIENYKHNTTIVMKKFLFFTIAFLLMPLIALAKGEDEVASYQIEGAGTGAQGTYLVKVWVVTDNKKLSDDIIGRCGVHGVLFKGFSNTETRQHQKPLAGSPQSSNNISTSSTTSLPTAENIATTYRL